MTALQLALRGKLADTVAEESRLMEKASTVEIRKAGNQLKTDLRRDVVNAGLGQRLANTWRGRNYPAKGESVSAAALVFSNAPEIVSTFAFGAVIRPKRGRFLAVPTENVPRIGGKFGRRVTPANWPEGRFGKLRFVRTKNGGGILVADNLRASFSRKTGEFRGLRAASKTARRTGRGLVSAVMFILVPQTQIARRLSPETNAQKTFNKLGESIVQNWANAKRKVQ